MSESKILYCGLLSTKALKFTMVRYSGWWSRGHYNETVG